MATPRDQGSPETPYPIKPKKPGGVLAFPAAAGGRRVEFSFSSIATKKTYKKGDTFAFAKFVMHPGLPRRILLPTEQNLLPSLLKTTINYIKEQERRGAE